MVSNIIKLIPACVFSDVQFCDIRSGRSSNSARQVVRGEGLTGFPCALERPEKKEFFSRSIWISSIDFSGVTLSPNITALHDISVLCLGVEPGSVGGAEWGEKHSGTPCCFRRKGGFRSREEEENQWPLWWNCAKKGSDVGTTWDVHDVGSNTLIVDVFLEIAICYLRACRGKQWASWAHSQGHHYFNFSLLDETSEDTSNCTMVFFYAGMPFVNHS